VYRIGELKTGTHADTCMLMLIVTLITAAKMWLQPKCPSTDEQRNKMQYMQAIKYYSALKRNKVPKCTTT
jgi:hypothetical protein